MSRRRLERLEGSLAPSEAVLRWLDEAHAFGSLPAYVASLVDRPGAVQPFAAVPAQVADAVYASMRRQRTGFIREAMREAVGDTVFLMRLVSGLNVHIEEVLRVETMRRLALYWWARALDAGEATTGGRADGGRAEWQHEVATLRAILQGTERARVSAEAKYLDGHDCLFPGLASVWRDLHAAATSKMGGEVPADDAADDAAERSVQRVIYMARADGLEAAGRTRAADELADRVARQLVGGGTDG